MGKSIKTSKYRIQKQLKGLWSYVEKAYKVEEHIPNIPDFEAIDTDKLEAIFGNRNFKRFKLRGIDKVNIEIRLIATAHNLKKYSLTI